MNKKFECIGLVGHPRHPAALATHEMLFHWLVSKGYPVIVEHQIAHDLKLENLTTSSNDLATPWRRAPATTASELG